MTGKTTGTDLIEVSLNRTLRAKPKDPGDPRAVALASYIQADV